MGSAVLVLCWTYHTLGFIFTIKASVTTVCIAMHGNYYRGSVHVCKIMMSPASTKYLSGFQVKEAPHEVLEAYV